MTEPILTPFLGATDVTVYQGDCIEVMRQMPENSVDAIVTDPPYGLEFMGKGWDSPWKKSGDVEHVHEGTDDSHPFRDDASRVRFGIGGPASLGFQAFSEAWAREAFRILKPGGHLLAFAGTRTYHRMASGVEDAGFEIRDCIAWMYGSGFPKSLDVSKAIDKAAGAEREVTREVIAGIAPGHGNAVGGPKPIVQVRDNPASETAREWSGWGTALKPAFEPVVVARKPLVGTVAQNVLEHGTGALNVDGCRIGYASETDKEQALAGDAFKRKDTRDKGWSRPWMEDADKIARMNAEAKARAQNGRWPANVTLDEDAAAMLDEQSGYQKDGTTYLDNRTVDYNASSYKIVDNRGGTRGYGGGGGASRFFYTAKASKKDRNTNGANNTHPTVKPTTLMRWLIRLVTPPGGIILDPFGGSGSTGVAARAEGVRCILIEREAEYLDIIRQRLDEGPLFANLD